MFNRRNMFESNEKDSNTPEILFRTFKTDQKLPLEITIEVIFYSKKVYRELGKDR